MAMTNITMQQLKQQRLTTAGKFILDTIKDAKAEEQDRFDVIRWYKDGESLFVQDLPDMYLWVNLNIWRTLGEEYKINNIEIQELIKNVMYKYTNNGVLTPFPSLLSRK
jgi:hypothetical protein